MRKLTSIFTSNQPNSFFIWSRTNDDTFMSRQQRHICLLNNTTRLKSKQTRFTSMFIVINQMWPPHIQNHTHSFSSVCTADSEVCVLLSQPRYLFSSTSVLQSQRATCFEFATLLCSLLLGAHYDAYCVSGYAVREMCLLDQSLQECPLLDNKVKVSAALTTVNYIYSPYCSGGQFWDFHFIPLLHVRGNCWTFVHQQFPSILVFIQII